MPPGCLLQAFMHIGFYLRDLEAEAGTTVFVRTMCDNKEVGSTEHAAAGR